MMASLGPTRTRSARTRPSPRSLSLCLDSEVSLCGRAWSTGRMKVRQVSLVPVVPLLKRQWGLSAEP